MENHKTSSSTVWHCSTLQNKVHYDQYDCRNTLATFHLIYQAYVCIYSFLFMSIWKLLGVSKKRTLQNFQAKWTQLAFDYFESKVIQSLVAVAAIASVVFAILGFDGHYSCDRHRHEVELDGKFYFLYVADIIFSLLTVLDYCLALTFFPSTFGYLYSWRGMSDTLAMIPIIKIFALIDLQSHAMGIFEFILSLLVFFRLSKICRIGLFYRQLKLPIGTYYIIVMVDVIVIFLLFVSTVLLGVDHYVDNAFTESLCIWSNSLYFTVSVISTVGFGDISANTTSTRILLSFIILIAVAMIPFLMANVMQMMSADRNTYSLSLYALPYDRWICICGITPSPQLIRDMLIELSNTPEERSFMIIILSPELPGVELSALLNDISYSHRIKYYLGSAKDPSDLARIRAEWANAIYIIGDVRFEASLRNQEDSNYLTCIAVNKYLNKEYAERQPMRVAQSGSKKRLDPALARLCSLSAYGGSRPVVVARLPYTAKNKHLLLNKGFVHVAVSQQEMKYALLSYGMLFPGFLSLYTQLCIQPADDSGITAPNEAARVRANLTEEGDGRSRILEIPLIQPGAVDPSQALFPLPKLSPEFLMLTFEQAVCYLYCASGGRVTLIGVLQTIQGSASSMRPNGMGKIFLNPSSDRGSREFNSELSQFQAMFVVSSMHRWDVIRDYCINFHSESAYSMISSFGNFQNSVSNRVRRSSINQASGENDDVANVKLRSSSITGMKEMFEVELETRRRTKVGEEDTKKASAPAPTSAQDQLNESRERVDFGQLVSAVYTPMRPTSERVGSLPGVGAPAVVALRVPVVTDELVDTGFTESGPKSPKGGARPTIRRMSSDQTRPRLSIDALAQPADYELVDPEHVTVDVVRDRRESISDDSVDSEGEGEAEYGGDGGEDDDAVRLVSPNAAGCVEKLSKSNTQRAVPRFRGHIVLVVAKSSALNITSRAYLIPLIAIIRTLRREVSQNVVVLSEKIPDLEAHLAEVESAQPGLLRNVLFVEGTNRHLDHLQSCNLEFASVILIVNPLVKAPRRDVITGGASSHTTGKDIDIVSKQALVEEDRAAVIATLNVLHALELVDPDSRDHQMWGWKPPYVVASIAHHSNALFLPAVPVYPLKAKTVEGEVGAAAPGYVSVPTTDNYDESTTVQTQTDYISTGSVLLHGAIEMCACIQSVLNPNILPLWEALLGIDMENSSHGTDAVLYRKIQTASSGTGGEEGSEVEEDVTSRTRGRARHTADTVEDEVDMMRALDRAADKASARAAKIAAEAPSDPFMSTSLCALDKICLPPGFAGKQFGTLFPALYSECGVIAIAVCRYLVEDHTAHPGVTQHTCGDTSSGKDSRRNHVLLPQVLLPSAGLVLQEDDEIFIVLSAVLN